MHHSFFKPDVLIHYDIPCRIIDFPYISFDPHEFIDLFCRRYSSPQTVYLCHVNRDIFSSAVIISQIAVYVVCCSFYEFPGDHEPLTVIRVMFHLSDQHLSCQQTFSRVVAPCIETVVIEEMHRYPVL